MLYYHEVFSSIQGEGYDSGFPTVFVRLFGCNVKCAFCDQPQLSKDRKRISVASLLELIKEFGLHRVCITGGEPLMQPEVYCLIYDLVHSNYLVSIETNGCIAIDEDLYQRSFKYIMDVKCPSSAVSSQNVLKNLSCLQAQDEVKFVISNREDYKFAKNVISNYPTKAKFLMSPVFDKEFNSPVAKELSEWLQRDKMNFVKLQLQIHKIINVR